ncbi:retrovirus-related pol polyprotein from transposon TNT 1-94 [Tanacetum coccineum]
MELKNTQNNALAKASLLKLGEYEMWEIRIKQYFQIQDYALWEVIENGNSWVPIPVTAPETGPSTATKMTVPSTAKEKTCKKNVGFIKKLNVSTAIKWDILPENAEHQGVKTTEIESGNLGSYGILRFCVTNDKSCSKSCLKNYEALKKQYDDLLVKLDDTGFKAATYKRGLSILKGQILKYKEHEVLFSEEIALLKRSVGHKEYQMGLLRTELEKVKQEKEGFEFKIAKFEKSAKDLDQLLASQITDKSKKGFGYNVVPSPHPLILNRPTPLDLLIQVDKDCKEEPKKARENNDAPIIEDWVSDDEDDVEPIPKVEKKTVIPTATKKEFVKPEKPVRRSVSFDHIQYNCPKIVHKHMALKAVLMKTGLKSVNTARPVNTVRSVNTGRPFSTARQNVNTVRARGFNAVKPSAYWVWRPIKPNGASLSNSQLNDKGFVDSGCSRHMTGNIAHLSDFKDFDGGYVTFGGGAYGGRITGKGTIKTDNSDLPDENHILLKIPRQDNMYSFDMKNIVPKDSLTCLVAKGEITLKNQCYGIEVWQATTEPFRFSWVFFLSTKDETTEILKNFIKEVENLVDKKVKIIRSDNGTEFKNKVMDDFCKEKGFKPAIGFMKPFGCFFVGYSLSSKAFRVYNTRTRKVQENLHIGFLENKPMIEGNGPKWLFDLDSLTQSMNLYQWLHEHFLMTLLVNKEFLNAQIQDKYRLQDENDASKSSRDDSSIRSYAGGSHYRFQNCKKSGFLWNYLKVIVQLVQVGIQKQERIERGIFIRNKARLVAQGHTQEEGIDYDEVFTPVARIKAIRIFLAYASYMGFMVYQMDVKSAFLYGQPPGFENPNHPDKVYKVVKALYGLHQAPRAWYDTLTNYLLCNGFQRGKIDQTLFIKRQQGHILLVQIYVDDIIFGSIKKELCDEFEKLMKDKFQMSSMGELTFFLGLQVSPKTSHLLAVKRIFRYLKGKPSLGLWYPKDSPLELVAYTNSDYAELTQK